MTKAHERWVVVKITFPENTKDQDNPTTRVFSGSYGGYTGSDGWGLSTQIIKEEEFPDKYEFTTQSGSKHICYKTCYGMSRYMEEMFGYWGRQGTFEKVELEVQEKYKPVKLIT